MNEKRLTIAILNLMPTKEATANQLSELVAAGIADQTEVLLLYPESHYETKPLPELLARHYFPFSHINEREIDGVIVTGAPVEQLAFEEVDYWQELCQTLGVIKAKDIPILAICWGAQAALYCYYQIEKVALVEKIVGVFEHQVHVVEHPVFDLAETFRAPHSRYTTVNEAQVLAHPELLMVADSYEAGLYLVTNKNGRETFVFGHPEYERDTLNLEYQRDLLKDLRAPFPNHYYPENQVNQVPEKTWQDHGTALFTQWVRALKLSSMTI